MIKFKTGRKMKYYFITGVTGDLGSELMKCLALDNNNIIYCLVRDKKGKSGSDRLAEILKTGAIDSGRVYVVQGDICEPKLGIEENIYRELAGKITHIIHSAGDTRFNQIYEIICRTNVYGTKNVISFAEDCLNSNPDFKQFNYISTVYVTGKRRGIVYEGDLTDRYGFHNTYERSKYEAELLVNEYKNKGLPVIIFRPSIIFGGAEDGNIKKTNVLYPALELYRKYLPDTILPAIYKVKLDIVPMDFVVNLLFIYLQTIKT